MGSGCIKSRWCVVAVALLDAQQCLQGSAALLSVGEKLHRKVPVQIAVQCAVVRS